MFSPGVLPRGWGNGEGGNGKGKGKGNGGGGGWKWKNGDRGDEGDGAFFTWVNFIIL